MQTGFVYYIYYIHLVCLIIPPTARKTLLTKSEMQMLLKDANWFRLLYLLYPLCMCSTYVLVLQYHGERNILVARDQYLL